MKKLLGLLLVLVGLFVFSGCGEETPKEKLVVYSEFGFAPFEYVSGNEVKGVDIDIMNLVGEELNKEIVFENVLFNTIVDAVAKGQLTNVGAAGLSITEERLEKVDFSKVYYQANLYVIYNKNAEESISKVMTDGNKGVYWSSLKTDKGIGVQSGTTADLFLGDEIAKGGSLEGVNKTDFQTLSVAINDIGLNIDYVIIDELPAKSLVKGKENLACLPLYYEGGEGEEDELAYDQYAIAVTKGQTELLAAINKVLDELLKEDENGVNGIQKLVNKHLGLE